MRVLNGNRPRGGMWERIWRSERGSVAVVAGLSAPVLLGFLALAIDGGSWERQHVMVQGAADQAALAAGLAASNGGDKVVEARAISAVHGLVHGQNGVTVSVNKPPLSGAYAGNNNAIEVLVAQQQVNHFAGIFRAGSRTVTGRSVAAPTGVGGTTAMCIMALDTTVAKAILMDGQGTVSMNNCDIYDNSSHANSLRLTGNVTMTARNYYLTGGWTKESQARLQTVGQLKTYTATTTDDPYATRVIPAFSGCNVNGGGSTIKSNRTYTASGSTPFVICNGLSFGDDATITFNPGVYIFDRGDFKVEGNYTINATGGVTLIFTSSTGSGIGKFVAYSTMRLNLNAPSTGPTAGMAIWVDKRSTQAEGVHFQDTMTLNIKGVIYSPANGVTLKGEASSPCTQIVAGTVHFIDTSNFSHNCAGVGTVDPAGPSSAMALVE